ncbi:hypothetical protein E2562_007821, partial [Oryza meyeriana var. granulata]
PSSWARPSLRYRPWHGAARGKPKRGKALAGQTTTKDTGATVMARNVAAARLERRGNGGGKAWRQDLGTMTRTAVRRCSRVERRQSR